MQKTNRINVKIIKDKYQQKNPLVMLTAYDAWQAKMVDKAQVDMILVGDSVGMTTLGFTSTVYVTMDMMLHHVAAVSRGVERAMVVADMPFLSCSLSKEEMIKNAGRFIQEAGADAVKIEGGEAMAERVALLTQAGIPVVSHLGLLPQSVFVKGGYFIQGRNNEDAEQIKQDALAVQKAGAFAVVLECVPENLAKEITNLLSIPTIGIGAGAYCSGQVQVFHDLLGLSSYIPKHAKCYANISETIENALTSYSKEVRNGTFFSQE